MNTKRSKNFIKAKHAIQSCVTVPQLETAKTMIEIAQLEKKEKEILEGYRNIRMGVLTSPPPNRDLMGHIIDTQ